MSWLLIANHQENPVSKRASTDSSNPSAAITYYIYIKK
jgi:hypothetical protein